MAEKPALTVKDRAVIHLLDFQRHAEEYEVPLAVTQEGIATAVGVDRSHAAQELAALAEEGVLDVDKRRIRGLPRKRKAYFLTALGSERARDTRVAAGAKAVRLRLDDGSFSECSLSDALERMPGGGWTFLQAYNSIDEEGVISVPATGQEGMVEQVEEGAAAQPDGVAPEGISQEGPPAQEQAPLAGGIAKDERNGLEKVLVGTVLSVLSFTLGIVSIIKFSGVLCDSPLVIFPFILLFGLSLVGSGASSLSHCGPDSGLRGYVVRWSMLALACGIGIQLIAGTALLMDPGVELAPLRSVLLVNASILAVVAAFRQLDRRLRAEMGLALGCFMTLLGFVVSAGAVFDLEMMTGPYWLVFGCTQMLAAREVWLYEERTLDMDKALQSSGLGIGGALFIAVAGATVASSSGLTTLEGVAAAGWLALAVVIFAARAAFPGDVEGFSRLCSHLMQAGIGGLLLAVGFLLMLLGRLAEGAVELVLCGPVLYHTAGSLFKRGEWREIFISLGVIFMEIFTLMAVGL